MLGQPETRQRLRLLVRGAVQGVGFRPLVYRLAIEHKLTGWIQNTPEGVSIQVEGVPSSLEAFTKRLEVSSRSLGIIDRIGVTALQPEWDVAFEIRESAQGGVRAAWIMPDMATCADCLRELFDPDDRRFRYPFLNCTQCGPRFSIIESLPYDRPNTTMRHFKMCADCEREYSDPCDRRFHAQPIACWKCGPHLELLDDAGKPLMVGGGAMAECARAIRKGGIIALKGLGGFQLVVDARSESAVQRLRVRKCREEKAFALMVPSLEAAGLLAEISPQEAKLLESRQAPIVLVRRRNSSSFAPGEVLAPSVAPGNPYLGMMLPYTPLHHLLLTELHFPIVATSGNRADEPICVDESDALARLRNIADLYLTHNRSIVRPLDDSVTRVALGTDQILRRARGYAPLPITLDRSIPSLLAVGGHLKNTLAVAVGNEVFLSQHIGDLVTVEAAHAFEQAARDLPALYAVTPKAIACDLHPDYHSTRFAERQGLPVVRVQHHAAHVLACMAENGIKAPALGVVWDGAGLGTDGSIWGGEFLYLTEGDVRRVAHLRPFPLPGGDLAMREPRRAALGLLYALFEDRLFSREDFPLWSAFTLAERETLTVALRREVHTPMTTSAGRLFDAAAALAGVKLYNRYEGQAAMEWEWCADGHDAANGRYVLSVERHGDAPAVVNWGQLVEALLADHRAGVAAGVISARFHEGLIDAIVTVCQLVNERQVVLSGGCFLNRRLLEGTVRRLTEAGFTPYWHQRIPTGDGGIALGQIVAAERFFREETQHVPGDSRQSD